MWGTGRAAGEAKVAGGSTENLHAASSFCTAYRQINVHIALTPY